MTDAYIWLCRATVLAGSSLAVDQLRDLVWARTGRLLTPLQLLLQLVVGLCAGDLVMTPSGRLTSARWIDV